MGAGLSAEQGSMVRATRYNSDGGAALRSLLASDPKLINQPIENGLFPLHLAVQFNNLSALQTMLDSQFIDPNCISTQDPCVTPLGYAVQLGRSECVRILLNHKEVDPNAGCNGQTPFLIAITSNYQLIARALLSHPEINPQARNQAGNSAVHLAIQLKLLPSLEFCLNQTELANINEPNLKRYTPLHIAAENGFTAGAKLLLEQDHLAINAVGPEGRTALTLAIHSNNLSIFHQCLNDPRIDVNFPPLCSPLITAIAQAGKSKSPAMITSLLRHPDIDVNTKNSVGDTALHIAIRENHHTAFIALLTHPSININILDSQGKTPLHLAVSENNIAFVLGLLGQSQIRINQYDSRHHSALHVAVKLNFPNIVCALLAHPQIDVNVIDDYQETPMFIAAAREFTDCLKLLLAQPELQINHRDAQGYSVLHTLARYNTINSIPDLLEIEHLEVCPQLHDGNTPMHIAAKYNSRIFLHAMEPYRSRFNQNITNNKGMTPMHIAAQYGRVEALQWFYSSSHHISCTKDGSNILQVAAKHGRVQCSRLILAETMKKSPDDIYLILKHTNNDGSNALQVATAAAVHVAAATAPLAHGTFAERVSPQHFQCIQQLLDILSQLK